MDAIHWSSLATPTPSKRQAGATLGVEAPPLDAEDKPPSANVRFSPVESPVRNWGPESEIQRVQLSIRDVKYHNLDPGTLAVSGKSTELKSGTLEFKTLTAMPVGTGNRAAKLATSFECVDKPTPQPLVQVLSDLARRNFMDPGIPVSETISYSFPDATRDPWEEFARIAQISGYRIVCSGDDVTLTGNNPYTGVEEEVQRVKAEVWIWLDRLTARNPITLAQLFN
jgi:hypothetical protein